MEWKKYAALLAIPAVVFVWMDAARPVYEDTMALTVACYVALANDITPLVDAGSPDAALASAECAATQKRIGAHADRRRARPDSGPAMRSEGRTPFPLPSPRDGAAFQL